MIRYLNLLNNVAELPARLLEWRPSSISQTHEGIVFDKVENEAFQSQLLTAKDHHQQASFHPHRLCKQFATLSQGHSIAYPYWRATPTRLLGHHTHQALRNQLSCLQNSHACEPAVFLSHDKSKKERCTTQCSSIKSNFVWPSNMQGSPLMLCTPQRSKQTMPKCPSNKYRLYSQVWTCCVGGNFTFRIIQRARLITVWSFWIIIHL